LFDTGGDKVSSPDHFLVLESANPKKRRAVAMENKLSVCYSASIALSALILGTTAALASPTPTAIQVETAADVAALNGTGAVYGPPSNATFPDGPFTVGSGTSATLSAGPAGGNADTLLLVLSATSTDVASLGTITLKFDGLTPVSFSSADFFTSAQGGFPTTNIPGIANGAVNGIKFPTAEHAAADITFSGPLTPTDAVLGDVTITSSINLRVDVFGDNSSTGLIVGNAANSGAEGITGIPVPIPEPTPTALFVGAIALIGVMVVRHRRRDCTSA
jgi:hypothetical protein